MKKQIVITAVFACFCIVHLYATKTKILAIGNSFSEDAVENYLYDIAKAENDTVIIGNMYIGGCSLETHWNNANADAAVYSYRKIDATGIKTTAENRKLSEAVTDEDWDYISFQQVSQNSGMYSTYFPYLPNLLSYVKSLAASSNVKYVLHQTWAYAQTSTHSGFANYGNNQGAMYAAIADAVFRAAAEVDIDIIIPAGTAIQNARTSYIGDNFCRDGFHLDTGIGRYTVACAWYEKLSGKPVVGNTFIPTGLSSSQIELAQNAAHNAVLNPQNVTDMADSFAYSQKEVTLTSPDGNLKFGLTLQPEAPFFRVSYKNQLLVDDSSLGFEFDNGLFCKNLNIGKTQYNTIDETYELVVGKTKTARNHCKEAVISLEEKKIPFRKINMVVRVFNDGIAFRYEFPEQPNRKSYVMYDEKTTFRLTNNPRALALFLPSYTSSHEGLYTFKNYDELPENELMDMPALFIYPNGTHLAITEAALVDYAGMYLVRQGDTLSGKLSPSIEQERIKVKAFLPHRTPWRVMMISDRVGALVESNLLTHLNEPCKIEDTSWIKPGKTTFTWWNGNIVPDTTFSPGNNFLTNKYYIDFAARNGLEFHSIYGYAEQPWYSDDGFNFAVPGPNVDITRSIAPLDMKAICNYAKNRGVDIHVWVHWKPLYAQLDKAFAQFAEWGISGMMVDFMNRDDQEMIRIQEEILSKAAKHHLFIQFHGSGKPSGLHRTYPNEFTREGTLNYEVYKWDTLVCADHDINIPFTRMLAGPTDYHLGGFNAVPRSEFKIRYTNPLVTSTRCHMLAMYIVLESYLAMVCDTPPSYEGEAGFEFLKKLPVVWDETKVPNAAVNEYITLARRKGNDWFVGCINNSRARTLTVSTDFLEKGQSYTAEIYTDAEDTDKNPNHLFKQTKEVTNKDELHLPLAANGGAVVHLKKETGFGRKENIVIRKPINTGSIRSITSKR